MQNMKQRKSLRSMCDVDLGPSDIALAEQRHGDSGYTLLELLVVLAIIGLLVAITAPQVMKIMGGAKSDAAALQIESLSQSLDFYELDLGAYPTTAEGLQALLVKPADVSGWRGPYVRKGRNLKDPWGRTFLYTSPGKSGAYDLITLGRDGKVGGDGDNADVINEGIKEGNGK
jgi:general secretion pathway protein G